MEAAGREAKDKVLMEPVTREEAAMKEDGTMALQVKGIGGKAGVLMEETLRAGVVIAGDETLAPPGQDMEEAGRADKCRAPGKKVTKGMKLMKEHKDTAGPEAPGRADEDKVHTGRVRGEAEAMKEEHQIMAGEYLAEPDGDVILHGTRAIFTGRENLNPEENMVATLALLAAVQLQNPAVQKEGGRVLPARDGLPLPGEAGAKVPGGREEEVYAEQASTNLKIYGSYFH